MQRTRRALVALLLPIMLLAVGGTPNAASAQQQEKRIALVIGNSAYAKSPLSTAANDAGLIAQTLQAAGFDVVGARDLDGDLLRKSLRDFIQKAQTSGPGTVTMIYLAGYGVQLAGENYFIPVGSNISRDTDLPTEALRISDYVRQLAAIPLKANIIVLDAARPQPFIEGGQPIASGLALVEPETNMLIAFNAAPGTVAYGEVGPYGVYAQSLAEMIRTGGLLLPEVFDRLRLRVNEVSKGAQVPWHAQKLGETFTFFERGPDVPPEAAPDQVAAFRDKPIRDLSVQDAYAAAIERDTLSAYEEFLAAYPSDPQARRVRAIVAARREAIIWQRSCRADRPEAYWSYLRRYPRGPHVADARRRLVLLAAPVGPPPSFAMIEYDVPPPPPEELNYIDRPVLAFSDPDFGFVPPPPPAVYFLPAPPPDFVVLSPPIAPVGLFVLPQSVFVPIPVFVRSPNYVVPPPNNIIYANIHNTTIIRNVINQPPPGPAPGSRATAIVGRAAPAGPGLPAAVVQRASLIQQGKLPIPPSASTSASISASIHPTVRSVTSVPTPANVTPSAKPQIQPRSLPANALPVPGVHGTPPAPGGARPSAVIAPARANATAAATPSTTSPLASPARSKPPTAQTPVIGSDKRRGSTGSPPLAPPTARPASTSARPAASQSAVLREQSRPRPPQPDRPPPAAARSVPPPRAQLTAQPTPPPVRGAPAPPPRPAPSPVSGARPVSPPAARQPPPPPHVAGAPPRPAAPAKKCPPNQPRC